MASCEQFQAQLLGYLYDLPEPEEREALREHLEQCGNCQAALARAERQKQLLAAAAKVGFAAVRFQPPPAGEVMGSEKLFARRITLFPGRMWLGGALAASIFLLLGCGVPATIWSWRFAAAQRDAQMLTAQYQARLAEVLRLRDERTARLARKRQEAVHVQEQLRHMDESRKQKADALSETTAERPLNLILSGPQTIQPGVVNSYEVATLNQNNQLVPSQLDVRVVDGNQLLFQRNYANTTGEQRIRLPANLPVKRNRTLLMEVFANQDGGRQEQIRQELALAAPVYLTHLTTDRPSYRPGETVYFRSLTLERFSLKPAEENLQLVYTLMKPTGEELPILSGSSLLLDAKTHSPLLGPDNKPLRGIGAGEFVLDPATPVGEYVLTVREANNRFASQQRKFFVGLPENRRPNREADIAAKKLQIDFYPEGGELVAGVPNRVYFQARTQHGEPADLIGRLIDQEGQRVVAKVEAFHDDQEPALNQGMGLFAFTPQVGRNYELKIDRPEGIEVKYELPPMKEEGVALSVQKSVTGPKEPIHVVASSPERDRTLLIAAYCRGRVMDHRTVLARKGEATSIDLQPAQEIGGVYRITVFEEPPVLAQQLAPGAATQGRQPLLPIAERLVYRKPAKQLHVALKPDKEQYRTGDPVKLSITARNEKEQPAPAVLLVAAVDKRTATLPDENAARSLPSYYYLTSELQRPEDLEDADILLGSHPKAEMALDLLLGTQGWRRFAEPNPGKFPPPLQEDTDRLVVTTGQSMNPSPDLTQRKQPRQTQTGTEWAKLQEQETKGREALVAAESDISSKLEALQAELAELRARQAAALSRVETQRALLDRVRSILLPAAAIGLATLVAALIVFAIRRGLPRGIPGYALAGVCCLLVVGIVLLLREMETARAEPAGLARLSPVPELNDELAVAAGVRADAAKTAEPPMEPLQRPNAEKSKEAKEDRSGHLAQSSGDGKGEAEGRPGLQVPLAANSTRNAKDKAQNLEFYFSYKNGTAEAAAQSKKAFLNEEQKGGAGKTLLSKDREGEALRMPQYRPLQKADGKQQLASKPLTPQQFFANRREAIPQTRPLGLNPGFQGGLGGAGPAAKPVNEQAGARPGNFGSVPGAPTYSRADKPYAGVDDKAAGQGRKPAAAPLPQSLIVREYAHERPAGGPPTGRADVVDTLYWHPVLVLPHGKAEVSFDLCDAAAIYEIIAVGHTLDGRLGAVTRTLEVR